MYGLGGKGGGAGEIDGGWERAFSARGCFSLALPGAWVRCVVG